MGSRPPCFGTRCFLPTADSISSVQALRPEQPGRARRLAAHHVEARGFRRHATAADLHDLRFSKAVPAARDVRPDRCAKNADGRQRYMRLPCAWHARITMPNASARSGVAHTVKQPPPDAERGRLLHGGFRMRRCIAPKLITTASKVSRSNASRSASPSRNADARMAAMPASLEAKNRCRHASAARSRCAAT